MPVSRELTRQLHNGGYKMLGHPCANNVLRACIRPNEASQCNIIHEDITRHIQSFERITATQFQRRVMDFFAVIIDLTGLVQCSG